MKFLSDNANCFRCVFFCRNYEYLKIYHSYIKYYFFEPFQNYQDTTALNRFHERTVFINLLFLYYLINRGGILRILLAVN
jgi:hypothetical protein